MDEADLIRLHHRLDAAREVRAFSAGRSEADLTSDRQFLMASLKCLEIIGEAAANVSRATQDALPRVPWSQITGMRHRLVHAYYDVNTKVVWHTITRDVPPLLSLLTEIVEEHR